ncbi:hypothetical protein RHCH11_RHCH11_04145 [Beijerinckiaceae bacterium RH CH11]|nr:hypothetical protein RHCH11_RHCH11_04145 [Beijerinckiaceae bacterium RH CH11]VVB50237.1 hypothetical protein RHAL8_04142 [Beijerinckiaceae bacterium RH AL8]
MTGSAHAPLQPGAGLSCARLIGRSVDGLCRLPFCEWFVRVALKQARRELTKRPGSVRHGSVESEDDIESIPVPFLGNAWKGLFALERWNDPACDRLMLPKDKDDARQSADFLNQFFLLANTPFGHDIEVQPVCGWDCRLERTPTVIGIFRNTWRSRSVHNVRKRIVLSSEGRAKQGSPCTRSLPAAHDQGFVVLRPFRVQAWSREGLVRLFGVTNEHDGECGHSCLSRVVVRHPSTASLQKSRL